MEVELAVVMLMGCSFFWRKGGIPPFLHKFENKEVAKWGSGKCMRREEIVNDVGRRGGKG
jgi:hypothetical protein